MTFRSSVDSRLKEAVSHFEAFFHPDIVRAVAEYRTTGLVVKGLPRGGRAFFRNSEWALHVTAEESASVILHEITHAVEYARPDIIRKTQAFLKQRADGEAPQKLKVLTGQRGYRDDEIAYKDKWVEKGGSNYMGKIYYNATELLTMGIERLLKDPVDFYKKDPEYFEFLTRTINDL